MDPLVISFVLYPVAGVAMARLYHRRLEPGEGWLAILFWPLLPLLYPAPWLIGAWERFRDAFASGLLALPGLGDRIAGIAKEGGESE